MEMTINLAVLVLGLALAPSDILCTPRLSGQSSNQIKLVFSQVIFRHGDRNPYPGHLWKDEIQWPEGSGQLTKLGIQQMHQLGKYLRRRYESILPPNVYPNTIAYAQSTDVDRTLMSAASLLAGLFPPTKDQMWNEKIMWQPVPIHTVPAKFDYILSTVIGKQCDMHELLKRQNYNRREYKAWHEKYDRIYRYIKDKSGISPDDPWHLMMLHDKIQIHQMKNKTIPDWASKIYDNLTMVAKFEAINSVGSRAMCRISTGFLLGEIIERFYKKIGGSLKPNRNLWLYSAHDITIMSLMIVLDVFDSDIPPYAANLCLELYEQMGQHFVQIVYQKKINETLPPLNIPGCGRLCPLNRFQEIYRPFIPKNDFETECKIN